MEKPLCKVFLKKLGTCGFSSLKPFLEFAKSSKVELSFSRYFTYSYL